MITVRMPKPIVKKRLFKIVRRKSKEITPTMYKGKSQFFYLKELS